jgi:hypothetical protein
MLCADFTADNDLAGAPAARRLGHIASPKRNTDVAPEPLNHANSAKTRHFHGWNAVCEKAASERGTAARHSCGADHCI